MASDFFLERIVSTGIGSGEFCHTVYQSIISSHVLLISKKICCLIYMVILEHISKALKLTGIYCSRRNLYAGTRTGNWSYLVGYQEGNNSSFSHSHDIYASRRVLCKGEQAPSLTN
jgi:hypothetical protein